MSVTLVENYVFKYAPTRTLLSDTGSQLVAHRFQRVYEVMEITNAFTTTYRAQTNAQFERFDHLFTAMMRSYVEEHPVYSWQYTTTLCAAYILVLVLANGNWIPTVQYPKIYSKRRPNEKSNECHRPKSAVHTLKCEGISIYCNAVILCWLFGMRYSSKRKLGTTTENALENA